MLYWEIIAVCSETHTEHINRLCGRDGEFANVKPCGTYSNTRAGISKFSLVYHYVKSDVCSVPAIFCYLNKEPETLKRVVDSRDKLCHVASNAAY
jgi:hypothetical protein